MRALEINFLLSDCYASIVDYLNIYLPIDIKFTKLHFVIDFTYFYRPLYVVIIISGHRATYVALVCSNKIPETSLDL